MSGREAGHASRNGATALTPTAWERARRWRPTRPMVALLVLVALAALLLTRPSRAGYLDPAAVDPGGSRALATLLADQGVRVADVTTLAGAVGAAPGGTVLMTDATLPTQTMVRRLVTARPAQIVLVGALPGTAAFDRFAAGVELASAAGDRALEPRCPLRAATRAGPAILPGPRYDLRRWAPDRTGTTPETPGGPVPDPTGTTSDAPHGTTPETPTDPARTAPAASRTDPGSPVDSATACYDSRDSAALAELPARAGHPPVVLLGSGHPLTNAGLDEQGNAALAMNLLGAHDSLVWWRPSPMDPALAGEVPPSPLDLLPTWVPAAVLQLLVTALLVAWWRGRRLGPVVVEPLPVVVPAGETTHGRARLLHAQHARGEAAEHLRAEARERLRVRVGVPAGAPPERLVAHLAARTGRPAGSLGAVLYGPEPTDDAALVRLEHDLGELVADVGTREGDRR